MDNWEPVHAANNASSNDVPRLDLRPLQEVVSAATQPVALSPSQSDWPELDASLLEDRRGRLPAFPLDLLPQRWARWIADTGHSIGAPADYVAQGVFAAIAAVCGAGLHIRVKPGWSETLVLWQALVGSPSSGKSPALAAPRRLLGEIEDAMRQADAQRRLEHETRVEQAELLTAQWKCSAADAIATGRAVPLKPAEANVDSSFSPSQLVVADATLEAMADVVAGNPRGVVMWRDELAAWLANQGRYANGGSDRGNWLEGWSASSLTINRRSRSQPLHLPKFPVGVIGTIQPDRIADTLDGQDDGMAARFLYCWPEPVDYVPLLDRPVVEDDEPLELLQRIAAIAATAAQPRVLTFEIEAVHELDLLLASLAAEAEAIGGLEGGWLGKAKGSVARLAVVLMLMHWSEDDNAAVPRSIGRAAARSAVALWRDYFRPHASAVFNQAGRADRDRLARRVLRWIQTTGTTEVSRENVRREALAHAVDAEGADKVIARLEAGGVLRLVPMAKGRGRPARRWCVNPAVAG